MYLKRRLTILFLSLSTIPIIFVGMLFFVNAKDALIRENLSKLESITETKAAKLNDFFGSLKHEMAIMQNAYAIKEGLPVIIKHADKKADPEYNRAKELLDERYRIWLELKDSITDMMILDSRGRIVYALNKLHQKHLDMFLSDIDKESYVEGRKSIFLGDMFRDEAMESFFGMLLTAPVYDDQRSLLGMVVFEINVDYLFTFLQEMPGLGRTAETVIGRRMTDGAGKKGEYVLFLNPLFNEQDSALKETIFMGEPRGLSIQRAVSGESGSGVSLDYRGKKVLSAWKYIPSLEWGIVTKIDMNEAITPANILKKLIVAIILIVVVLTGLIGVAVANSIAKPIHILHRGTEIIGEGKLHYKIGIDTPDEIGQLSRAIDEMTENLAKTTASVDILNKEIESRKAAERELEQARKKAEEASRAKSDFLAHMSHELRTPLNAVIGFSEILKDESFGPVNDKQKEYVTDIWTSGKHLLALINDILDLSKVEAGRMNLQLSDFDLGEAIDSAIDMVKERALAHHITIIKNIKDNKCVVTADERKLKQVLFNLCSNAIKFTPDGGTVGIDEVKFDAENIMISVWDTGIGIEAANKDRIFKEFEQIDSAFSRKESGTGLGLALTKKLVELHGGKIWFESEGKDKGSSFSFVLPMFNAARVNIASRIVIAQKTKQEILIFIAHFKDHAEKSTGEEEIIERVILRLSVEFKHILRAEDCLIRKNENTIVLLLEIPGRDYSGVIVKCKDALKKIMYETDQEMRLDCFCAVARYPDDGNNAPELLEKAEKSLVSLKTERLQKKILVVDDEEVVTHSIKELLLLGGYKEVLEAHGGEEALQQCVSEQIDLLILDLCMPVVSGYEVIARLKEYAATKDVAIIIMSGSQEAIRQFKEGSSERVIPIINKPIDIKELLLVMSRLL